MNYNVLYKKSVNHDLKKLSKTEACRVLDRIEDALSRNPESNSTLKGKFAGLRSFRVGDIRVIYTLMDNNVIILRIGNRRDVYKSEI